VRVIGTLVVLAAVAFVLGAGAGLLWKEPSLILADWFGDTQEVAWSQAGDDGGLVVAGEAQPETPEADEARPEGEPESPEATEDVTAAPEPSKETETKPEPPAAEPVQVAARPATPPVSAAPPRGGVAVQVGAFAERGSADGLVKKLRGQGFPAYVAAGDRAPWRVRVGPFRDRAAAEGPAAKLAKLALPTWILEEPGR
jgi:cell division septation protein DedD